VLENTLLRRIFGSKRDYVAGGWSTLRNEKLRSFYSSPNFIRMRKSRKMGRAYVTHMGEKYILIQRFGRKTLRKGAAP
jgi:hypothetical protein